MSLIYVPALPTPQTEFNNSLPELLCSDDDSGNEDVLDMEYTEAESESLKRNAEVNHQSHHQLHLCVHVQRTMRCTATLSAAYNRIVSPLCGVSDRFSVIFCC